MGGRGHIFSGRIERNICKLPLCALLWTQRSDHTSQQRKELVIGERN